MHVWKVEVRDGSYHRELVVLAEDAQGAAKKALAQAKKDSPASLLPKVTAVERKEEVDCE